MQQAIFAGLGMHGLTFWGTSKNGFFAIIVNGMIAKVGSPFQRFSARCVAFGNCQWRRKRSAKAAAGLRGSTYRGQSKK